MSVHKCVRHGSGHEAGLTGQQEGWSKWLLWRIGTVCRLKDLIVSGADSWRDWFLGLAAGEDDGLRSEGGIHLCVHDASRLQAALASESQHMAWEPAVVQAMRLGMDTGHTGNSYWRHSKTGLATTMSHL